MNERPDDPWDEEADEPDYEPDDPFDDDFDDDDDWDDFADEDDDPFVMMCDTANCCMPGPHYLSECHTLEMMEDLEREAEEEAHRGQ